MLFFFTETCVIAHNEHHIKILIQNNVHVNMVGIKTWSEIYPQ